MIRALLTVLALAACAPTGADYAPRPALLAHDVVMNIRVDFSSAPQTADIIAAQTANLLGPPFRISQMSGHELILNMTGRATRGTQDGAPTLVMDWDIRDQGGTSIALFRVAILSNPTLSGGVSDRDARGLAFYTAEKLTQQTQLREIIRARRHQ